MRRKDTACRDDLLQKEYVKTAQTIGVPRKTLTFPTMLCLTQTSQETFASYLTIFLIAKVAEKLPSNLWLSHSGLHTLSLIREKLWIVHARTLLRRILRSYVYCRKKKATAGQQKMACLPADRVIPSEPPFNYVGVDCFLVLSSAKSQEYH